MRIKSFDCHVLLQNTIRNSLITHEVLCFNDCENRETQ